MPGAPYYSLHQVLRHPLARMLPIQREQMQTYRLGEKHPPAGHLRNHAPTWEAVSFVLGPLKTLQARVNLQRNFSLVAITCSSSSNVAGGFRAQLYDKKKDVRFADRGIPFANIAGNLATNPGGAFFLREPYLFDQPDSQLLVVGQNLESVNNTIQIALYGLALRFNDPDPNANEFPGGPVPSESTGWGCV